MDVTEQKGGTMETQSVTSLLTGAMNKATAKFIEIPAKYCRYLDWRRYNALITYGSGREEDLPDFLSIIDYIKKISPYKNDDLFLSVWKQEQEEIIFQIQGKIILDKLDTANLSEIERFVKIFLKYIKRNIN